MNPLEQEILAAITDRQDELYEELAALIKFDSQNFISHGLELECQKYVAGRYRDVGLITEMYAPDDVTGIKEHPAYNPGRNTTSDRPNVSGILPGIKADSGSIMLAGHTDTMPVGDLAKWHVDPFGGVITEDKIIGLGAGDNKAGVAVPLFVMEIMKQLKVQFDKTINITAYVDEEYGGGGGALAASLKYDNDVIINLDGGNFEIWRAALGGGGFKIIVRYEKPTDTVTPLLPAVMAVAAALENIGADLRTELHNNPYFTGSDMERSAMRIIELKAGEGGSKLNEAALTFVAYTNAGEQWLLNRLQSELQNVRDEYGDHGIIIDQPISTTRFFESAETEDPDGYIEIMQGAADAVTGRRLKETGACLTDLSKFLTYGSAWSFKFGILRDFDLEGGAHQPNEFVSKQELLDLARTIALFLLRAGGGKKEQASESI